MTAELALHKAPFPSVTLTGGLWKGLMETNRDQTLSIQYEQCLKTGRMHAFNPRERKGGSEIHIF